MHRKDTLALVVALVAVSSSIGLALSPAMPVAAPMRAAPAAPVAPVAARRVAEPMPRVAPAPRRPSPAVEEAVEAAAEAELTGLEGVENLADRVVALGFAVGDGAQAAWLDELERLRADAEDAGPELVAALVALPAGEADGPVARALIVALGEVGGEAAWTHLQQQVEAPVSTEPAALVTRSMTMEALARATFQDGNLNRSRAFRVQMTRQVEDEGQPEYLRAVAAALLQATAPTL